MQAGCKVDRTNTSDDHLGGKFNHLIACLMSVIVIDCFKMITVNHDQNTAFIRVHLIQRICDPFAEGCKIHESRQLVDSCSFLRSG